MVQFCHSMDTEGTFVCTMPSIQKDPERKYILPTMELWVCKFFWLGYSTMGPKPIRRCICISYTNKFWTLAASKQIWNSSDSFTIFSPIFLTKLEKVCWLVYSHVSTVNVYSKIHFHKKNCIFRIWDLWNHLKNSL